MQMNYYTKIPGSGRDENFSQVIFLKEDESGIENQVVNIYPELKYETFEGFGGAVTESAGYVYHLMNEEQKKKVINRYFSAEQMNYRLVRVHIDSCDFSLGTYEAMSDPEDTELESFSFERTEKYIIPMLEDAQKEAEGELKLMLTPWSPPAFMKTNGKRVQGGRLKPEYRKLWAKYICRYIREFEDRGFKVQRISIQNEAKAVQTWDSCLFTTEEEKVFLRDFLYPVLEEYGYQDIEVFIWDHNKERIYERVRDTVDEDTRHMITGAAFHWYSGEHFAGLDLVRETYPDLKLIMSESCLEYSLYNEENINDMSNKLCHEIIGDLSHGMCAFYDWNLLLDEKGGPNHVNNYCHAPFLYDTVNHQLMPQKIQEQYYMFSHFISPGAIRIASTKYTEKIDTVAYQVKDGKLILVLLNKENEILPVNVRVNGMVGSLLLPAGALAVCELIG